MKNLLSITFILLISGTTLFAQATTDREQVAKALQNLEDAIVSNDGKTASSLLHDDAVILEGGGIETKAEYLSHHFHSDGKFLSAINREEVSKTIKIEGDVAWVSSKTKMTGTYSGREIDMNSLELAVLKKENGMWKVIALHWSSR